jgi:hypothetical protein
MPKGDQPRVRLAEDDKELEALLERWTRGGKVVYEGPGRVRYELPDGTQVQWRDESDSGGATIDVGFTEGAGRQVHLSK